MGITSGVRSVAERCTEGREPVIGRLLLAGCLLGANIAAGLLTNRVDELAEALEGAELRGRDLTAGLAHHLATHDCAPVLGSVAQVTDDERAGADGG
jgi:hypothetical protein